jgi:hypothetical protein
MNDEAKKAILARRRRFVVAALAATSPLACDPPEPRACLSTIVELPAREAGREPLVMTPSADAGAETEVDAAGDETVPPPRPRVCLLLAPAPSDTAPPVPLPQVCLRK